jgi:hypothetical protein
MLLLVRGRERQQRKERVSREERKERVRERERGGGKTKRNESAVLYCMILTLN